MNWKLFDWLGVVLAVACFVAAIACALGSLFVEWPIALLWILLAAANLVTARVIVLALIDDKGKGRW